MGALFEIMFEAVFELGSYLVHRRFGLLGCGLSILLAVALATFVWFVASHSS